MQNSLLKVCCIASVSEAKLALEKGANYLGLVSSMPSGPGVLPLNEISIIVKALPVGTQTVLLTSKLKALEIVSQHKIVNTWGIQLVDRLSKAELIILRKALPGVCLIQVIHISDISAIAEALSYNDIVDMLILDSGNPEALTKILGGTGKTHDWEISREICRLSEIPVLLAGGLNPENICAAFSKVKPAGVDVCSGVRSNGHLDKDRLLAFMLNLNQSNQGER
ncbi:phosphoribosylanthranilate isomerase [bacterium]|nr:phosphoribosylanthranilate isomerase [bacterium]